MEQIQTQIPNTPLKSKKLWRILGYVIAVIIASVTVISMVGASAGSDVEKAEIAFQAVMDTHFQIERTYLDAQKAYNTSKDTAQKYCAVLVALKHRDNATVQSETCGLGF